MSAVETLDGPPIPKIKHGALVFDRQGPHAAKNDCVAFLTERGFSIGVWQVGAPCAVVFGHVFIPKWGDLAIHERQRLHGLIMGDGYRGPLVVKLTSSAPQAARDAIDITTNREPEEPHSKEEAHV